MKADVYGCDIVDAQAVVEIEVQDYADQVFTIRLAITFSGINEIKAELRYICVNIANPSGRRDDPWKHTRTVTGIILERYVRDINSCISR